MSIKDLTSNDDSFLADTKKEVIIKSGGKNLVFYANAISYLENQNISGQVAANKKNVLALLAAASISDNDGNKFTYDEILKLKEEFAKPLLDAALEANTKGQAEKKLLPPTSSGAN